MSHLAAQQQALLAALFDWPDDGAINKIATYIDSTSARGLKAYKANGHALADRALRAAYPVLVQLLGAQSFDGLARALWHVQPPTHGDVAQWGAGVPDFVRASDQLQDVPYLGDVAALEWALHSAASAPDADMDASSFALLATQDPAELCLRLAPGCSVQASIWPVASIWAAHAGPSVSFDDVSRLLQAEVAECALVWRAGLRTEARPMPVAEYLLVKQLLAGHTLGAALDNLSETPEAGPAWDISRWLAQAVQSGLLLGVVPCAGRGTFSQL